MGCSNSKEDDLPIVSLCRQRRDLIRAASDRRYDLSAAHSSYFRAIDRVGDALHRFVVEELTAVSSPLSSPLLTLPPSDGKAKSKSDDGSILSGNGNGNGGIGGSRHLSSSPPPSSASSFSLSHSGSGFSHSHLPEEENADPHSQRVGSRSEPESGRWYGQENFSSFVNPDYYVDPVVGVYGYRYPRLPPQDAGQFSSNLNSNYKIYPNQFAAFPNPNPNPNPNYYYMKKSSTIPSTFYMDPNVGSYGYTDFHSNDMNLTLGTERENVADSNGDRVPPPPPPAPEGSGWDFFNVFDTYDQFLMDFKGRLRSGSVSSSRSSPGSSEIREKEGIPDLEEETETESFREVAGSGIGYSKSVPLEEVVEEKTVIDEKVSERDENRAFVGKKGVSFEEEDLTNMEGSSLGSSLRSSSLITEESGVLLHGKGTKDVVEAVEEIKEQFKWTSGCGEEVAKLLEGGKRRYRLRRTLLKVVFCRILDSLALSALASFGHSSSNVHANVLEMNEDVSFDSINIKSTNLSATLEKLYVWEKKLYKEVKDEEKMRIIYEKECRKLKALDGRGAESAKIDSTEAAIRKLVTKISIAIKSVDAISRRIHKLRDEELQPQLVELVQRLTTMWNSMLACHQKQFQSLAESNYRSLTSRSRNQGASVAEATMQLEVELRNWSSCFRNWIITQKAYIEALNGWLTKWLLHEQEETPDGVVPFSPSRIGAPTIFVVSNDLHRALERISEVGVTTVMHVFADNVHELWESQVEERRQKLKAEYLSRDFSRRRRSLNNVLSDGRPVPLPSGDDYRVMVALDDMRRRLDEETAKHREIVRNVREAASSSLQVGLVPIFEALRNYTAETLKAYEGIRIPSNDREGA